MTDIPLSLIVAAADNNVIGKDNKLLWHIPADLKRFKTLTLGKPCIMGRKTYESILDQLGKPLPGRTSIVISASGYTHDGAIAAATLEEAVEKARAEKPDEIMVIGGAQIYALALPLANRIHLTRVHIAPEGDAFFPALNENEWKETARESAGDYDFITLERG